MSRTTTCAILLTASRRQFYDIVKFNLPCHADVGLCVSGHLWEAGQKVKTLYDGSRKHRSHATALSSVGMTCFLKPATPANPQTDSTIIESVFCLHNAFCPIFAPNNKFDYSMSKTALITGITGQDGSFLAELLLEKGYEVHGIIRRSSSFNTGRIEHLYLDEWVRDMKNKRLLTLHYGDMTDSSSLVRIIQKIQPDEIYNLAAQSHVKVSFDCPEYTAEADAVGTLRLLEAVRILGLEKKCRIYQASTSELFGKVQEVPQKETTPFYPRSPYGVAKQYGFWIVKNYRESYGMFAVNGILFNHESERRGETFVTRKITLAAARIKQGYQDKLYLGNLNALRDWGYAKDYVECMWLIMQQEQPEDFVIATGEYHTVREFCTLAFHHVGIELRWEGEGVDEKGIDSDTGKVLVEVDPRYFRPAEVEQLLGDPTKAKTLLGWNPRKTSFEDLVKIMVEHDMKFVKKLYLKVHMNE